MERKQSDCTVNKNSSKSSSSKNINNNINNNNAEIKKKRLDKDDLEQADKVGTAQRRSGRAKKVKRSKTADHGTAIRIRKAVSGDDTAPPGWPL